MDWLLVGVILIAAYAVVALYIWRKKLFADRITFYGPIMAIKSTKVAFFDSLGRLSVLLRLYGTFGVVMVAFVSVLITAALILSLQLTLVLRPEPTGIYAPQNILLLPGINQYVPSTFAVWFAFVLTIAVHEFGHGFLCRIENIRVKGIGALIAVIPIGFFVEPDEEDLEKVKGLPKMRMFGAGITNNLVLGTICFVAMILIIGLAVPTSAPVIHGVYQNYSAEIAGVPPDGTILALNGTMVVTRDEVSALLNATRPNDTLMLTVESGGIVNTYNLTLTSWPQDYVKQYGPRTSGFMGVEFYDGAAVIGTVQNSLSPIGFLRLISVPFDLTSGGYFRILSYDAPEEAYYQVPFPLFWGAIHVLFWAGWININVGIFNALPLVPLDGGYIMKEGVERLFARRGISKYAPAVVSAISSVMLVMLLSILLLPYLLHL